MGRFEEAEGGGLGGDAREQLMARTVRAWTAAKQGTERCARARVGEPYVGTEVMGDVFCRGGTSNCQPAGRMMRIRPWRLCWTSRCRPTRLREHAGARCLHRDAAGRDRGAKIAHLPICPTAAQPVPGRRCLRPRIVRPRCVPTALLARAAVQVPSSAGQDRAASAGEIAVATRAEEALAWRREGGRAPWGTEAASADSDQAAVGRPNRRTRLDPI